MPGAIIRPRSRRPLFITKVEADAVPVVSLHPAEIGGSEGLVMSNRTNRTLSANSNRLNLGTRSLALVACVNGTTTLRFRLAHVSHQGVFMRDARMPFGPSITDPSYPSAKPTDKRGSGDFDATKSSSSSSPSPSWPGPLWLGGCVGGTQGYRVVAEAPPVFRQVVDNDVPSGRAVPEPGQPQEQAPSRPAASARASRAAGLASRSARLTALASAAAF
jgi:hypothetical protein